jgi:hypothetical protein
MQFNCMIDVQNSTSILVLGVVLLIRITLDVLGVMVRPARAPALTSLAA